MMDYVFTESVILMILILLLVIIGMWAAGVPMKCLFITCIDTTQGITVKVLP